MDLARSSSDLMQHASRQTSLAYRPAIDGLRAVAVLSVFVFHLNHGWLPGGFVGVDAFFVISGYLITLIICEDCKHDSFSFSKFYQRRIARIFPAFFLVALVTLAGARFIYSPQDLASAGANLVAAALSVANLKFMVQGNYFQLSPDAQPYLHYWSLSVEEQFYLLFPLLLVLLFKHVRRHHALCLGCVGLGSFVGCVLLTHWRPTWAFYLLPTRAWELLAGCVLAVRSAGVRFTLAKEHLSQWISWASLGLLAISVLLVNEGNDFPGFWALLPVAGAVGVLMPPRGAGVISEKWLSAAPLVLVGRMSYSLYLWHWPVFSMVDYQMYLASEPTRLLLKIGLSFLAAAASFWFVENPARQFLNRRQSRPLAYAFMLCALAVCLPLGLSVRKENYVNAELRDVERGGLVFNQANRTGTVMLMGDSHGSMYGKVVKEICAELGCKLTVISTAGGDPLPDSGIDQDRFWLTSLALVRKEKPDCLILACSWASKLQSNRERLAVAVATLKPLVGRLLILNQPPVLPEDANRAAIRSGRHPPFFEDTEIRSRRLDANNYLMGFNSGNSHVVDIASHFQKSNGEVLFLDGRGRQLYHDADHLSGYGADLIRPELEEAILPDKLRRGHN